YVRRVDELGRLPAGRERASAAKAVELRAGELGTRAQRAAQLGVEVPEREMKVVELRHGLDGAVRGRERPKVGHEVRDGGVGLVAHRADDRDPRGEDGARD